jgi:hypothetical protein
MSMNSIEKEIRDLVNTETHAWDTQNAELLVSIFHQDMVWPWPRTSSSHDPMDWIIPFGKYDRERWRQNWQELFDTHKLVHNHREIKKVVVSEQGDGAFAVVDIDTLWRDKNGNDDHWKGRVCKVYTKNETGWKLIMHTGVLEYD